MILKKRSDSLASRVKCVVIKVNAFDLARTSHIDIAIAVPSSMEVDLKNQDFIMK